MDLSTDSPHSDTMQVVYEGHYALPGDNAKPNLLRVVVDYDDGAVFVVRSESRQPEPAHTDVSRFYEPNDDDWRAGHGVAFDQACQQLVHIVSKLEVIGYRELPTSPGWAAPPPCVLENYLLAERSRHPLPVMH